MAISISFADSVAKRYGNQIAVIGEGRARPAFARAVNRVTTMARTRVIRAIVQQSSIPRSIVVRSIRTKKAAHQGGSVIEGIIFARGAPLSLKHFKPRQLSYGVRAKVWGEWRQYPTTFMGPRPGVIAPRLGGHVFQRTSSSRLPIEMIFGPSVPQEMVKDESARAFEQVVASHLPARISHELARLLPK